MEGKPDKKIVFIGPPGSGKTTITEIYFNNASPTRLLTKPPYPSGSLDPLDPLDSTDSSDSEGTLNGINSYLLTWFNRSLVIYDLPGQENSHWLSNVQGAFEQTDALLCVFDIRSEVGSIISYIIDVINVRANLRSLSECKIYILLHKIDVVNTAYRSKKVKLLREFLNRQYNSKQPIEIHLTSVIRAYFYKTYKVIFLILKELSPYDGQNIPLKDSDRENIRREVKLLLNCELFDGLTSEEMASVFEVSEKQMLFHLKRLERLGFIQSDVEGRKVQFTSRGKYFKEGLQSEIISRGGVEETDVIELLHTFLSLNEGSNPSQY